MTIQNEYIDPHEQNTDTILDKNGNNEVSASEIIKNIYNTILLAFKLAIQNSLTIFNMVDGIVDEYEDESGIDTVNSENQSYNSSDDYYSPDSDTNTVLLLHCNGSDESTTFTDSSPSSHTMNANGNVKLDTSVKKWGTASLEADGTGDYLTSSDSADWDICGSNADSWTIDFWIKFTDYSGNQFLIEQYQDGTHLWALAHVDGNGLWFYCYNVDSNIIDTGKGGEINDTDWHHIALCKVADKYACYLDGSQVNYTQDSSTATNSGTLYIGTHNAGVGNYFTGNMDEIRFKKSNAFNASPNVGLTDTIVVPTSEYTSGSLDMTLISDSFTAETAPDVARIVIFEEDIDSITLNTDLKAYASNDDGSNWHQGTLSEEGNYDASKRVLIAESDVSAQSNTNMVYKITTHNGKDLKIHGTGFLWD